MTEKELYDRVTVLQVMVDELVDDATQMPPTVDLCVFVGKLGAVLNILDITVEAGVPVHDPDEEAHPLGEN